MDKQKKTHIIDIILLLVCSIFLLIIIFVVQSKDNSLSDENNLINYTDSDNADIALNKQDYNTDEEYYGTYNYDLGDNDKNFIYNLRELYSQTDAWSIITKLKDYKLSSDFMIKSYDDKVTSPTANASKKMIYFAGVYKDSSGKYYVDDNTKEMVLLKAGRVETDPEIYILPADPDISREDFLSVIANGDYYNSMDRATADIYNLIDGYVNVMLYFDENGNPVIASVNSNIEFNVTLANEYPENASLADAYEQVTELSNNN